MTDIASQADQIFEQVQQAPKGGIRRLIALVGAPASGKSTLAEAVAERLTAQGDEACVVPMDGFHLDDRILTERGLLARKGAAETFDSKGFVRLIKALGEGGEVIYPIFDRSREIAIAGAGVVPESCQSVVVEGNYLLLDAPVWRDLAQLWDFTIFLDVPTETLRARLMERWLGHGYTVEEAKRKAEGNDLLNAEVVLKNSLKADFYARL
ncbi:nucleoside/nucleotide kinase family protein [Celeribacter litoreus]|uniref:nucleoside/nucleotide kinase family protein n=1 Tax=Celeribacter litoreus TaxID=2876714 RepID=UPI001CCADBB6|nr:nucleoside/nucleotide kinase family protein [Celeribacter litoreus]MCA0044156.1 nucleoside/nucleotide kinase family protein [Celeribacter litoreus]